MTSGKIPRWRWLLRRLEGYDHPTVADLVEELRHPPGAAGEGDMK